MSGRYLFHTPLHTLVRFASEDRAALQSSIFEMLTLRNGWHYGSGKAPTPISAIEASKVLSLLVTAGAEKIDTTPVVEGGVCLSFFLDSHFYECDVLNSGTVDVLHSLDDANADATETQYTFADFSKVVSGLPAKESPFSWKQQLVQYVIDGNDAHQTDPPEAVPA